MIYFSCVTLRLLSRSVGNDTPSYLSALRSTRAWSTQNYDTDLNLLSTQIYKSRNHVKYHEDLYPLPIQIYKSMAYTKWNKKIWTISPFELTRAWLTKHNADLNPFSIQIYKSMACTKHKDLNPPPLKCNKDLNPLCLDLQEHGPHKTW